MSGLFTSELESVLQHFPDSDASGFPDGLGYFVPYHLITDTVGNLYEQTPETPIAIDIESKIWDSESRIVDLTITMRNDGPDLEGTYGYNIFVTEDNLKSGHETIQGCSTPDDTNGFYIRWEYFNFWVARKMVILPDGDSLVGPSWFGQQAITRSCSFTIDTAWIPQNCNIVVNVYKKADSLYKSPVLQVIKESITNVSAIPDEKTLEKEIIGIFPNPATDITNLHFSLSTGTICSLKIFDMNGQMIKDILQGHVKQGMYNIEIDTREFPNGTYLVVLKTSTEKRSKKIIIQ